MEGCCSSSSTPSSPEVKKTKESKEQTSLIGSNWPSLPVPADSESPDSPIQPGQGSPAPWKVQQRGPDDFERDRVGKYAQYFVGNEILPIPEIVEALEPRILSLVVSDLKTRRLVGLKKEAFEELLKKAGIPCQYFCRKSFATWDVLLPTEAEAAKAAKSNITTRFFRLQPEYKGTRRVRVTVCNVPAFITGEVLASYLSAFGRVEEFNLLRSSAGTAYGDYTFRLCLTRDGFQAIPETLVSRDRQMMVVVEGRRPRCWGCKQVGHIAKFCPQKAQDAGTENPAATAAAATTTTIINNKHQVRRSRAQVRASPRQITRRAGPRWPGGRSPPNPETQSQPQFLQSRQQKNQQKNQQQNHQKAQDQHQLQHQNHQHQQLRQKRRKKQRKNQWRPR